MSILRWFVRPFRKRKGKKASTVGGTDKKATTTNTFDAAENKKFHNEEQQQQNNTLIMSNNSPENDETILEKLNHDQMVLITPSPSKGYLIYSLIENDPSSTEENSTPPFILTTTNLSSSQLPTSLTKFLLQPENTPPAHLHPSNPIHVLLCTHSGLKLASSFYSTVLNPLLNTLGLTQDSQYKLTLTTSKNTIKEFASQLQGDEIILLLSGDGGVVDLINSFASETKSPVIILLPLGTANALFHSLHKDEEQSQSQSPSSLVVALRTLIKGQVRKLPTFRVVFSAGSKFVETEEEVKSLKGAIVASYGFHASLVYESDTDHYRKFGAKRFGMAAGELLKLNHGYDCVVSIRTKGKEGFRVVREGEKFGYVLVTLVSNLEKTFTISPESRRLDGRLRLVYFGDLGEERTMEIMRGAYDGGKHVGREEVGYEEVEEVRVEVLEGRGEESWRVVCIDGTIVRVGEGGWWSVKREEGEEGDGGWRVWVG